MSFCWRSGLWRVHAVAQRPRRKGLPPGPGPTPPRCCFWERPDQAELILVIEIRGVVASGQRGPKGPQGTFRGNENLP